MEEMLSALVRLEAVLLFSSFTCSYVLIFANAGLLFLQVPALSKMTNQQRRILPRVPPSTQRMLPRLVALAVQKLRRLQLLLSKGASLQFLLVWLSRLASISGINILLDTSCQDFSSYFLWNFFASFYSTTYYCLLLLVSLLPSWEQYNSPRKTICASTMCYDYLEIVLPIQDSIRIQNAKLVVVDSIHSAADNQCHT